MSETLTKLYAGYSIGPTCYEEVGRYCRAYGSRILLLGGKTALEKGLPSLQAALARTAPDMELVDTVVYGSECTYERIQELTAAYTDRNIHMVFGMGGGKAADTAKSVACRLGVPVFTFPTIASNCASMSAMSVIYHPDGSFADFYFHERPAVHCFMNTEIMVHAPRKYIRAGMGDTIAKYFECHFSARGDELDYHSALGREISNLCYERIHTYAKAALGEMDEGKPGTAFEQIVLTIVVNTGLVSHLVEDCYNCAVAHSVCYGLDLLPGVAQRFLHGDLVGYGVLVQLALDGMEREEEEVRTLLNLLEIPVSLAEMGVAFTRERLAPVLAETVAGPDMEHIPYPVTEEMIWEAMKRVESLAQADGLQM